MAGSILLCPKCRQSLASLSSRDLAGLRACPSCGLTLAITVFPAYGKVPLPGRAAANRANDADAACFFHPTKRAEVPCDRCGRYLCALCQLVVDGQNLCPACVLRPAENGSTAIAEKARLRWDLLIWVLVVAPPLTICFGIFTPLSCVVAIGIGIWKLRSPPSRIHRSRLRLIGGIGAAVGVLVATIALVTIAVSQTL